MLRNVPVFHTNHHELQPPCSQNATTATWTMCGHTLHQCLLCSGPCIICKCYYYVDWSVKVTLTGSDWDLSMWMFSTAGVWNIDEGCVLFRRASPSWQWVSTKQTFLPVACQDVLCEQIKAMDITHRTSSFIRSLLLTELICFLWLHSESYVTFTMKRCTSSVCSKHQLLYLNVYSTLKRLIVYFKC